ncbi:MAG: tetratricopeptide repeat protein [Deltaproteobacteria bacterium]|jgi:tetratricopeptide (TPR) repeat protein|nr:tetratricopeptide repeat protein [Deltaproteobacteria bacterium]
MKKNKEENNPDFENLAKQVEIFKESFDGYLKRLNASDYNYNIDEIEKNAEKKIQAGAVKRNESGSELSIMLFEVLLSNYYLTVIQALKKLSKHDKQSLPALIETCADLFRAAPKIKYRNYIIPQLFNLCSFLYEIKEAEALTFFYNLLIYAREIPVITNNIEYKPKNLEDYAEYESENKEDPFAEFRRERSRRDEAAFDPKLFDKAYDKFFLILSGWKEKINGYYTKDEICFMNGLFIMDELADCIDLNAEEKNGLKSNDIKLQDTIELNDTVGGYSKPSAKKELFRKIEDIRGGENGENFSESNGAKNIYGYVYREEMQAEIYGLYDKALRYFQRAMAYNPNNPRYHYEYARCLKNSGKSEEAEIFFKKALDLNAI